MPALTIPFDETFDVQIAAARARNVVPPQVFYGKLPAEKRAQAFTVSGLVRLDQVQAVADALAKAQASGQTFADFQKWAQGQDWSLPNHRLELLYRNAAQTAYMAGHWRHFDEFANRRPYLMYDAVNDSRTRPHHLALDGVIKPVGDAFWKTHACPNGHNCRCTIRSLDREEAMRRGGITQQVPAEGAADEGWGHKPTDWGAILERLKKEKLSKAHPALAEAARQALADPAMPPLPRQMLDGLVQAAQDLGAELTLKNLWANAKKYEKHVDKRISIGHAQSLLDYQQKTFLTLANAQTIVVVVNKDPAMYATGKVAVSGGDWLVLLSKQGRIVTSYQIDLSQPQFEQRHMEKGDQINEYEIDQATREELARLFGAR